MKSALARLGIQFSSSVASSVKTSHAFATSLARVAETMADLAMVSVRWENVSLGICCLVGAGSSGRFIISPSRSSIGIYIVSVVRLCVLRRM